MATRRQVSSPAAGGNAASSSLLAQLSALGIRPKKGLGQNFLVDPAHRARIVAAAELTRDDTVLEIGPGPGVLTELIAEQAGRVIAVELDDRLIPLLRNRFASQPHVSIVHADILKVDVGALMTKDEGRKPSWTSARLPSSVVQSFVGYKVIANLPYYLTSAVIRQLLESTPPPERLVLTVQREVAERMVAAPPEMSLLALGVQFYCTGQIVEKIPAGAFYPVPKVDSAVVRLDRRAGAGSPWGDLRGVFPCGQGGIQPAAQAVAQLAGRRAAACPGRGGSLADGRRHRPAAPGGNAHAGRVGRAGAVPCP